MPLNAVILDDEPLARQRLRRLLGKVAGAGVQVVAECTDVDELMRLARRTRVDVLFLDIELPGGASPRCGAGTDRRQASCS